MRKVENAAVASVAAGDMKAANDHLQHLLLHDRRRAWWALFRAAAAKQPDCRRDAMIAMVSRVYMARRMGRIVGVNDEQVVRTLAWWLTQSQWHGAGTATNEDELKLLECWLPRRIWQVVSSPQPTI